MRWARSYSLIDPQIFQGRYLHRLSHESMILYPAMEKWNLPSESLQVVEYNLNSNKANSFSVTIAEVEGIKGYIKGSVKDMQSLLKDPENNIPLPEDQSTKVEDERVIGRCNFRKVCKG